MEEGKEVLSKLQAAVVEVVEEASRIAHRDSKDGQAAKQTGNCIVEGTHMSNFPHYDN